VWATPSYRRRGGEQSIAAAATMLHHPITCSRIGRCRVTGLVCHPINVDREETVEYPEKRLRGARELGGARLLSGMLVEMPDQP
jgi:hypothetical protein